MKISKACEQLIEELGRSDSKTEQLEQSYDVFISYSHRNVDVAKKCHQLLQESYPDIKIFFDYDELKAGLYII